MNYTEYIKGEVKTSWEEVYDDCSVFQDDVGEIGLSDIADIHSEKLSRSLTNLTRHILQQQIDMVEGMKIEPTDQLDIVRCNDFNFELEHIKLFIEDQLKALDTGV